MNSKRDIYLKTKERLVIQKTQLLESDDWTDKTTELEQATDTDFLELNETKTDQEQRSKANWTEMERSDLTDQSTREWNGFPELHWLRNWLIRLDLDWS